MINYDGMKGEKGAEKYPMLPEGAYVAVVKAVKIDGAAPDQQLVLRVDVAEGEQKDYFTKRYQTESKGSGKYPAKYKGDFRMRIPNPGNPKDQWPTTTIRRMNNMIWCFENSNRDFHWSGDEKALVGKLVGINMQLGTYNDSEYTAIGRLEPVEDVRNGTCKKMEPKKPRYSDDYQGGTATQDPESGFTVVEDVEVPF